MKSIANNLREIAAFLKQSKKINTPFGKKTLNTSYQIPYLAGYSKDGKTVYIDKRYEPVFELKDGRKMNITKYLVIHELTEKDLEDNQQYKYPYAHEKATGAERDAVEADGYPWDEYQKYALSEVHRLYKLGLNEPLPKNLDEKPETDTKDYSLLKEIHELQKLRKT